MWSNNAFVWRFLVERERLACSEVVVFREVEACTDPPSPALAFGKGTHNRLGTRCCLGKSLLDSIGVKFGVVVVEVGLGHGGGDFEKG